MATAELMACPFCGGEDITISSWDVKCGSCGTAMPGGANEWNRRAEARQAPLPAGTVTEEFRSKFQLWFFRDMTDDQRRKLFGIFGMPVDDLSTHDAQQIALRHILEAAFAARPAEPVAVTDEMVESVANAMIAALADGRARVNADEPTTITNLNVTALARAALSSITETGGAK